MSLPRYLLAALPLAVVMACGGALTSEETAAVTVAVAPAAAQVPPGGTVTFTATASGTADGSVTWSLQEPSGGTIDASGRYVAPQAEGTYHVVARSVADPSASGTATVTVVAGTPNVVVVVTPAAPTVSAGGTVAFAAAVTGTSDGRVTWTVREASGCGSVTPEGLYTAPGSSAVCHVVATSVAAPAASATSTVTVTSPATTCSSFTYSGWGACQPNNTQTRTVLTSSPAGCAGGSPVLSQACTYVPPPGGEVLAFPGAEGFGARATGGRGGRVIKVTSLAASGPGSLQAALDVNAPRIVVFDVSGVIQGDVLVRYGNVTIAGQTAPGGGLTIAGHLFGAYDASVQNIIVRHLRVRPPRCGTGCDAAQYDGIQFSRNSRLIIDHVSVAYGADETIDIYEADDVTVQWTTIEASQVANHPDGQIHNYGLIHGPDGHRISYHHNLCANHSRRCPAIANGPADVRNNVAYNVRHAFLHSNPAQGDFNLVGNFFKQGPNDSLFPFYFDDEDTSAGTRPSYYLRDSYVDDPGQLVGVVDNPWAEPYFTDLYLDASHRTTTEFDLGAAVPGYVPVTTATSLQAYEAVLAGAGAFPRDAFTAATVDQVRTRTGGWDPALPADLMAGLVPGAAPVDTDADGMPDAWEVARGLNPSDGEDHRTVMASGYTAIEEYVNGLADASVP
jgi:pectate lyase